MCLGLTVSCTYCTSVPLTRCGIRMSAGLGMHYLDGVKSHPPHRPHKLISEGSLSKTRVWSLACFAVADGASSHSDMTAKCLFLGADWCSMLISCRTWTDWLLIDHLTSLKYSTLWEGDGVQLCLTHWSSKTCDCSLCMFVSSQVDLLLVHPHFLLIVPPLCFIRPMFCYS